MTPPHHSEQQSSNGCVLSPFFRFLTLSENPLNKYEVITIQTKSADIARCVCGVKFKKNKGFRYQKLLFINFIPLTPSRNGSDVKKNCAILNRRNFIKN